MENHILGNGLASLRFFKHAVGNGLAPFRFFEHAVGNGLASFRFYRYNHRKECPLLPCKGVPFRLLGRRGVKLLPYS